jgi:hypothetical protein
MKRGLRVAHIDEKTAFLHLLRDIESIIHEGDFQVRWLRSVGLDNLSSTVGVRRFPIRSTWV